MCIFEVLILLPFIVQLVMANRTDAAPDSTSKRADMLPEKSHYWMHKSISQLADVLVDEMFARRLKMSSLRRTDLDATMVGKASHLTAPFRTRVLPCVSMEPATKKSMPWNTRRVEQPVLGKPSQLPDPFNARLLPCLNAQKAARSPIREKEKEKKAQKAEKAEKAEIDENAVPKKERHKYFDNAVITVRSGDGGKGEVRMKPRGQRARNFKYKSGGNIKKRIWLSHGEPVPGSRGGDVIFYADPKLDSLLHLHSIKRLTAPKGQNADIGLRIGLGKTDREQGALWQEFASWAAEPLKIGVPMGTVVRRKRTRKVLAELTKPWQEAVVLYGGRGGVGVERPSPQARARARMKDPSILEIVEEDWKAPAEGEPGEEVTLQLFLRVVADIGIIGLPSAGKSSLLAALTRATPEVAEYPFTTLIPNLGGLNKDEDDLLSSVEKAPVLADLPGLIEGAHEGRGLGRNFLRHLSRTHILLHCVDVGSEPEAVAGSQGTGALDDYDAVRDELRMYNPRYLQRPYVVALTKMDLPGAAARADAIESLLLDPERYATGGDDDEEPLSFESFPQSPPVAVVRVSAVDGTGMKELNALLARLSSESRTEDDEFI
eukprot:gnl/TRDRNA2_/TRDRNA2_187142_c0_seq1.p1 gnl/TRDRNA2_/TRDRNA2_187142_c0~~gnl/TRDRNA2_/TRDRNA2_187142_c0_seq1.p1  ORF type:complete len:604 (-),score=109.02 gnl/TRDRNA2_/TRDRNA2_187142_c0_seq1:79-1890(-)